MLLPVSILLYTVENFNVHMKQIMSDPLSVFNLNKLKQKISLSSEKCPNFANQTLVRDQNIASTVDIPYEYLLDWQSCKHDGKLAASFVKILNAFISQNGFSD